MKNQKLIKKAVVAVVLLGALVSQAFAQNVNQIRWKSAEQVRAILGEPQSVTAPVGTHARYTMWKYENHTVAFSNGRAFHLFGNDSLRRFELQENRPTNN